ncbi:putative UDP-glucuronate:xylan alpha-glucuronosyltransferase 3 isoform X1 [Brachypodium distachyon]|uniref:Hexosyltransferase n=1 Tax=Brachypodium distachyon TaxID=15368 RepID=A0A0Q3FNZ2_BRADI|nr:putative UDP-glucuronate:xylan alpha-glucuronosyltransferase 3 isoform X1 [Brachypodium distachyon]XP_014755767.1 putative UDP-glucuronate:xylan alpha-glucuronosyltransferase 3 isoform X1 [Brachypodium distachyon]XP_014755769.1 putative UDP-glucuronate:xylan alpha-glucuronosyltransferase 3 isoform X1 [Brachypodium distachyon]XP_024317073.1 putative UDP-glucuronate:xylan alpha-glucuronosyltransferase 3 isoform X1 [Brachypodium distachyon]XP_024317074.1 putative UDP-glucuronate:xylan alpha-glu|eukprot:XP_014755766.1 putative UDP-glucuronate:xylan alpha-glucuronosyltransferase 3 isoform X1 [Brachypodium distachyon]
MESKIYRESNRGCTQAVSDISMRNRRRAWTVKTYACNSVSKKGYVGSCYTKHKPLSLLLPEGFSGKMLYVKLVLILLMCASFMGLLHSPSIRHGHGDDQHSTMSPEVSRQGSLAPADADEPADSGGYASSLRIDWSLISKAVQEAAARGVEGGGHGLRVGLLNFDGDEVEQWRTVLPESAAASAVHLERVGSNVTWEHLYPEWIDEEELYAAPTCPDLPEPQPAAEGAQYGYDIVAVKLPCSGASGWSKHVPRLHLQLAAARLASGRGSSAAHVVVVSPSRCFPAPNLFRCKDEAMHDGDVWLYRPDMAELRHKLALPVGSCKLAMPLKALLGEAHAHATAPQRREAFATILHSEQLYACGAIVAAQSIRTSSAPDVQRDMVALVDETISSRHRAALELAGWKVRTIRRIRNPRASPDAYNEWNYSKFWLWTLTDYSRVVFLDADLLVQRAMDPLFAMPELSATGNHGTLFNSGVMVIEPCNCTFSLLMSHIGDIGSYNGGDQGYLNEVFSWWHRLPSRANYMKHFWSGDSAERREAKRRVLAARPPVALAVHFVGMKPWFCFRDYDCNWNAAELRQFASDEAHARWWEAHDAMRPTSLRRFCLLDERQKALLRWDAMEARKANFSDGHWRERIVDPRRRICADDEAGLRCREREIEGRRVEGNRVTTSYAKLIHNF